MAENPVGVRRRQGLIGVQKTKIDRTNVFMRDFLRPLIPFKRKRDGAAYSRAAKIRQARVKLGDDRARVSDLQRRRL
jgi:hypothetical protein